MHPNLVELTDSSKQEAYNCNNISKEQKKKLIEKNWGNNGYKAFDIIDCENMAH